jgi:hypothetical protein
MSAKEEKLLKKIADSLEDIKRSLDPKRQKRPREAERESGVHKLRE